MAPVQHQRGTDDLTAPPPAHHRHGLDTLPRGSSDEEPREQGDDQDAEQDAARRRLELDELDRAPLDHAAERVDHLRRLRISGGDDERTVPQILLPVDRGGPASLAGRSGRTVVRVRMTLTPTAVVRQPRERVGRIVDRVGQQHDVGLDAGRGSVGDVAAEAFGAATSHVQRGAEVARVRSCRGVHDRVRALALELVGVPVSPLSAGVLRVADADRFDLQRLVDRRGGEQDLDELPIALVLVVPVVVVPVEPVLDGKQVGMVGLLHDVGVHRGGLHCGVPLEVPLVQAAGLQRVAGKIEVEALPQPEQVTRRWGAHHRRIAVADLPQRDLRVVEQHIDGHRRERLAGRIALLFLILEHHDRRVAISELLRRGVSRQDRPTPWRGTSPPPGREVRAPREAELASAPPHDDGVTRPRSND